MGFSLVLERKWLDYPHLKLKISETRLKIMKILTKNDLTAVEIGKKVGISRAMVYKHLNGLIEMGLVKRSNSMEKYSITNAGILAMYLNSD